jgi:hypothetical protein
MEAAGFEMGKPPQGPPPFGEASGMQFGQPQFVQDSISKYEAGELTRDDIDELISSLKQWGEPSQGIFLDQTS